MKAWLARFFAAPTFEDPEKSHLAQLVNAMVLIIIAGALVFAVASVLGGTARTQVWIVVLASAMFVIALGLRRLLHLGYIRLAGTLITVALWITFTIPIVLFDGLRDSTVTGYYLVAVMSALVLGAPGLVASCTASVLGLVMVFVAESNGFLTTSYAQPPPTIDLATILITLSVTSLLAGITARWIAQGHAQAQRNQEHQEAMNRQLQAESDRAQTYLDVAGVIVVAIDRDESITLINDRGCDLLGWKKDEILGRNWFDTILPERSRQQVRQVFHLLLAGDIETAKIVKDYVVTRSGKERLIAWHNAVLRDEHGRIIGTLSSGQDITERRKAEEALHRNLSFLETLIDTIPGPVFYKDTEGIYRGCNEAFAQTILGIDPQEVIGKSLFDLPDVIPEDLARLYHQRDMELVHEPGVQIYDAPVQCTDGDRRTFTFYKATYRDRTGAVAGMVGVMLDISERVQTQEALTKQAAELQALVQVSAALRSASTMEEMLPMVLQQAAQAAGAARGCIYVMDPDHGQLVSRFSFPTGLYPLGLRHELGQGITGHVAATGQIHVTENLAHDPMSRNHESESDYMIQAGSHLSLPLHAQDRIVGVLHLARGEIRPFTEDDIRLSTAVGDIAANALWRTMVVEGLEWEINARTVAIAAEREKSDAILRSVGEAIIVFDLGGRVEFANEAFEVMTGYAQHEVVGQQANTFLQPGQMDADWPSLQAHLSSAGIWEGEATVQRKNGRTYDAALTVAPMRDAQDQIIAYVASHRDISQRKELERARNRFMSNVSHELRTPVTSIKLYARMLREGRRPEQAAHFIESLENQANRLIHLIQDILDMAELDSGLVIDDWRSLNPEMLLRSGIDGIRDQAKKKEITLEIGPSPDMLPQVQGDASRLGQALGKVLENAVTFTPKGGQVSVGASLVHEQERPWVTLSVTDTGPGISREEQSRVFDRLYRGSLAESGNLPGTGLGLSIAQEIVHSHGGRITVDSELGKGSTFTLWLPVS